MNCGRRAWYSQVNISLHAEHWSNFVAFNFIFIWSFKVGGACIAKIIFFIKAKKIKALDQSCCAVCIEGRSFVGSHPLRPSQKISVLTRRKLSKHFPSNKLVSHTMRHYNCHNFSIVKWNIIYYQAMFLLYLTEILTWQASPSQCSYTCWSNHTEQGKKYQGACSFEAWILWRYVISYLPHRNK